MSATLPKELQLVRRDLGDLLFHWTKQTDTHRADKVLEQILIESSLRGSGTYILANAPCVCFTEAPITEAVAMLKVLSREPGRARYEPYGIAVSKRWLFEQGGRPVIYGTLEEGKALPESLRWRHVTFNPAQEIDFTWEREWRVQTESLTLEPPNCLVIVPTVSQAYYITIEIGRGNVTDGPAWLATALSFFGFSQRAIS